MTLMTTPSTHPCPDLEELAAFVDGRLAGGARASVVEHLASCEDCYEVYAETLRVVEDLEAEPAAVEDEAADDDLAPVVLHPRSFPWAWPAAAAALAAAAAVVLVVLLPVATSRTSGELVAVAGIGGQTRLDKGWQEHGWSTTRSGNPYEYLDPAERSFRVGVRVVDLRSALELDDRDTARSIVAGEIIPLLEAEEFGFPMLYEDLAKQLESGALTELIEPSAKAEEGLGPENEIYFELGKWVESARLAALTGNVRFFKRRDFGRFLRDLPKQELGEDLTSKIAELEVLLGAGSDTETLQKKLDEIIELRKAAPASSRDDAGGP